MISSRSKTPSPTKSPRRIALSSKDSNIRQLPLSKSTTPQLSPFKEDMKQQSQEKRTYSRPTSRSSSPQKEQSNSGVSKFFQNKTIPQLGFTIFSDSKDYSAEFQMTRKLRLSEQDENETESNKENLVTDVVMRDETSASKRVLKDLSICDFPGFVQYADDRETTTNLDVMWSKDMKFRIPSYVTPPRGNRTKYISFVSEKDPQRKKKRSNSQGDVDSERVVKKLVFDIHKDS